MLFSGEGACRRVTFREVARSSAGKIYPSESSTEGPYSEAWPVLEEKGASGENVRGLELFKKNNHL